MTLFGLGTATVDLRISTADYGPDYRAKLLARETRTFGGGAISNALHQAALLGASAQWLGRLGDDRFGAMIRADLAGHRVGTDHVVTASDSLSPFNVAVYAGPRNRRVGGFLLPNCLAEVAEEDLDAWAAALRPGDWCLVEVGEVPVPAVLEFCRRAVKKSVSVVLDVDLDPLGQCVGGTPAIVVELFSLSAYILPNVDAMAALYPGLTAAGMTRAIHADHGRPVVTTAGAAGCCCAVGDEVLWVPAPLVDVVDTVGAGDAFHGAFVAALMAGETLEGAAAAANVCGAANCTAFGARAGMIDRADLERRRREGEV